MLDVYLAPFGWSFDVAETVVVVLVAIFSVREALRPWSSK